MLGSENFSDASIFKLNDDIAIVQSLDFFTPLVDDPYAFGQIAAANSLSDIYAVGARPITALNIVSFPVKDLPMDMLKTILKGGMDKIYEAGALIVGGHSIEDQEPKYGLSITGIVHPEKFIANNNAAPGDILILTKPLGIGILATALKVGLLNDDLVKTLIEIMSSLNKEASEAMIKVGVSSATDITGFGLIGHAIEMATASNVTLCIDSKKVPIIEGALDFANIGMIPEGDYENKKHYKDFIKINNSVDRNIQDILFDAQTSGGLLISVNENNADILLDILHDKGIKHSSIIGTVEAGKPSVIIY